MAGATLGGRGLYSFQHPIVCTVAHDRRSGEQQYRPARRIFLSADSFQRSLAP